MLHTGGGLRRDPPHMIVKRFGCMAIHNKALYKCIIHSFIRRCWICGVTRSAASKPSSRRNRRTAQRSGAGWTGRFGQKQQLSRPHPPPAVEQDGPQDDPKAFLDLFEKNAEAGGWPKEQWPVRPIPLLSGEAQLAAQQLPMQNLLVFDDLKKAILQRVARSPEQHRQRFRSLVLGLRDGTTAPGLMPQMAAG